MPFNMPVMPFVFLALLLLPIKLQPAQLKSLAFALWMMGGIVLLVMGIARLMDPSIAEQPWVQAVAISLAAIVGMAKGKLILGKTSNRNIQRIESLTEPQKPIHVYSLRSWITIGLMVLIAVSLNVFACPLFWRGVVNLGVGLALIVSSLNYLAPAKKLQSF
jgi:hypothetical protein